MIELSHDKWAGLRNRLVSEYGRSILISYVCKEKLGFTVRDHKGWRENKSYKQEAAEHEKMQAVWDHAMTHKTPLPDDFDTLLAVSPPLKGHSYSVICLDFYSENHETWFRLKYL